MLQWTFKLHSLGTWNMKLHTQFLYTVYVKKGQDWDTASCARILYLNYNGISLELLGIWASWLNSLLHLCLLKMVKSGFISFIFLKKGLYFKNGRRERDIGQLSPIINGSMQVAVVHTSSEGWDCTPSMLCPQCHRVLEDKVIFSSASFRGLIIGTEVPAVFVNIKTLKYWT